MLVGYARVSKSETQDITVQNDALKALACDKIFEEAAIGGRWDRPELDRMLDELQADDVVVVQSLDRLTSSLKDLLFVLEKIGKCGAHFRTIMETIDTSGPSGQMVMHMLRSLADFERAQVRERTGEGLRAARARGHGGGRTPKLSPTQKREIMDMLAAGRSAADLARLFRVHPATISRLAAKTQQIEASNSTNVL